MRYQEICANRKFALIVKLRQQEKCAIRKFAPLGNLRQEKSKGKLISTVIFIGANFPLRNFPIGSNFLLAQFSYQRNFHISAIFRMAHFSYLRKIPNGAIFLIAQISVWRKFPLAQISYQRKFLLAQFSGIRNFLEYIKKDILKRKIFRAKYMIVNKKNICKHIRIVTYRFGRCKK